MPDKKRESMLDADDARVKTYYVAPRGEREGPFDLQQLKQYSLTPETPAWQVGLPQWTRAKHIREIRELFGWPESFVQTAPPAMPLSEEVALPPSLPVPGLLSRIARKVRPKAAAVREGFTAEAAIAWAKLRLLQHRRELNRIFCEAGSLAVSDRIQLNDVDAAAMCKQGSDLLERVKAGKAELAKLQQGIDPELEATKARQVRPQIAALKNKIRTERRQLLELHRELGAKVLGLTGDTAEFAVLHRRRQAVQSKIDLIEVRLKECEASRSRVADAVGFRMRIPPLSPWLQHYSGWLGWHGPFRGHRL